MSSKKHLLVVDDEPNIRRILQVAFEKAGYEVTIAEDAAQALQFIQEKTPDCVLSDVTMPGMNGHELLRTIKASHESLPVIIMTAFGTIPAAVNAIREGAFEYVTKPFDLESLKKVVSAALTSGNEIRKPAAKGKKQKANDVDFIAESPAMQEVLATVRQVADSRATVLVTGESGAGKEVIARAIHKLSARATKPFVAVSCAALPETLLESELFGYEKGAFTGAQGSKAGRFELADSGTLFLDEIGEIPLSVQVKLLRVLQEREFERLGGQKPLKVDVRLITATNADLAHAVDQGTFRLDLMYRLKVVEIHIPPLRERTEDILPLANFFLEKFAAESGREPLQVGEEALAVMTRYSWPGNVRELENTMERATVLSGERDQFLRPDLLPKTVLKAA